MTTDPAKRTDRTARKATAEQVMELSRNLPLTRSVPGRAVENATPGQLGFLAELFTAENASRAESKRNRLLRQAGFPQSKELDGYDRGHGRVPRRLGTRTARVPRVHRPRRGPRAPRTTRACAQDPTSPSPSAPSHANKASPSGSSAASGLIMRLRKAKTDNRLDQELKTIGKADLLIIERARLPAHRHRRRQAPIPGSSPTATVRRSIIFTSNLEFGRWGDVFGDRGHGRRRHRPHRPATAASSDSTANPTETPTHSITPGLLRILVEA